MWISTRFVNRVSYMRTLCWWYCKDRRGNWNRFRSVRSFIGPAQFQNSQQVFFYFSKFFTSSEGNGCWGEKLWAKNMAMKKIMTTCPGPTVGWSWERAMWSGECYGSTRHSQVLEVKLGWFLDSAYCLFFDTQRVHFHISPIHQSPDAVCLGF